MNMSFPLAEIYNFMDVPIIPPARMVPGAGLGTMRASDRAADLALAQQGGCLHYMNSLLRSKNASRFMGFALSRSLSSCSEASRSTGKSS